MHIGGVQRDKLLDPSGARRKSGIHSTGTGEWENSEIDCEAYDICNQLLVFK